MRLSWSKRDPQPASLVGFHKLAEALQDQDHRSYFQMPVPSGCYSCKIDVDHHREGPAHEFGLGFETEETQEIGKRMERSPAEKDDERLCHWPYRGLGDNAGDDGGLNV